MGASRVTALPRARRSGRLGLAAFIAAAAGHLFIWSYGVFLLPVALGLAIASLDQGLNLGNKTTGTKVGLTLAGLVALGIAGELVYVVIR